MNLSFCAHPSPQLTRPVAIHLYPSSLRASRTNGPPLSPVQVSFPPFPSPAQKVTDELKRCDVLLWQIWSCWIVKEEYCRIFEWRYVSVRTWPIFKAFVAPQPVTKPYFVGIAKSPSCFCGRHTVRTNLPSLTFVLSLMRAMSFIVCSTREIRMNVNVFCTYSELGLLFL